MSWFTVHWILYKSSHLLRGTLGYALRVLPYAIMTAMLEISDIQLPSFVLLARQRVA